QHVSGIEALVGGQQDLEVLSSATLQVLLVGKECILLAFDELAFFTVKLGVFLLSYLVEPSPRCIKMWNLSNRMAAWGAFLFVDFRNGFHISITARRTLLLLLSPRNAKNPSMLSFERSLPPNQIARRRSR